MYKVEIICIGIICLFLLGCGKITSKLDFEKLENYSFEGDDYYGDFYIYSKSFLVTYDSARIVDIKRKSLIANQHKARFDRGLGVVVLKIDGKWGAVGNYYKEVIPFINDTLFSYHNYSIPFNTDIHCLAKQNGKYGFYNKEGQLKIPFEYDWARNKYIDNFMVKKNEKFGLLNRMNEEVIPIKYDTIFYFNEMFVVEIDGKYGIKNKLNEILVSTENDTLTYLGYIAKDENSNFYSLFTYLRNGKWGLCNMINKYLTDPISDTQIERLIANRSPSKSTRKINSIYTEPIPECYYSFTNNNRSGIVNSRGSIIIPAVNDSINIDFEEQNINIFNGNSKEVWHYVYSGVEIEINK